MTKKIACKICYYLEEEYLIDSEDYNANWRFALYVAITHSYLGIKEDLNYEHNHNQWGVAHRMRGLKQRMPALEIRVTPGQNINEVQIKAWREGGRDVANFCLQSNNFTQNLYTNGEGPNGQTILNHEREVDSILTSLGLGGLNEPNNPEVPNGPDVLDVEQNYSASQREKLRVFYDTIKPSQQLYQDQTENRQSFIATLFGAGLFYLPHTTADWNGKISERCLIDQINGIGRKVKDHINPRKRAATHLLKNVQLSYPDFVIYYNEEAAPFMYVTPAENNDLRNYYLDFEDYQEALDNLQITVFPRGDVVFDDVRQLNRFINFCSEGGRLMNRNRNINLQDLENWYGEFINPNQ